MAIIVGRNPVREALERGEGQIEKVVIQQGLTGKPIDEIRRAAVRRKIKIQYVPAPKLSFLAEGANHQGVLAIVASVEYLELEDMLAGVAPDLDTVRATKPILLILDQIEDPHNYGAILRSAVAAGASGVIVPRHNMAPLSTVAIKASAGTAMRIPIAHVTNVADTIEQLKERGYWIAGAAGGAETSVWDMDWDRPVALVIGSEGKGMRQRVAEVCDFRVSIPIRGEVESLNASVAAGILLFAAARVRA
jgi:23S rRNA (guanosine2251-2'-O)-methyltransferase